MMSQGRICFFFLNRPWGSEQPSPAPQFKREFLLSLIRIFRSSNPYIMPGKNHCLHYPSFGLDRYIGFFFRFVSQLFAVSKVLCQTAVVLTSTCAWHAMYIRHCNHLTNHSSNQSAILHTCLQILLSITYLQTQQSVTYEEELCGYPCGILQSDAHIDTRSYTSV